jgi:hypothetical protein
MSEELISREEFSRRAAEKTRGKPSFFAFGYLPALETWILFPVPTAAQAAKLSKEFTENPEGYEHIGDVSIRTFPLELARHLYHHEAADIEVYLESLPVTLDLEKYIRLYPED